VKELSAEKGYPVDRLCRYLHLARSAYYRWHKCPKSKEELKNERLSEKSEKSITSTLIWDTVEFEMN
jgi:hypothetical protein